MKISKIKYKYLNIRLKRLWNMMDINLQRILLEINIMRNKSNIWKKN